MALPTSGPLSIEDIAGEFGGVAPHSLTEYYGVDSGIPASGPISILDFYGASSGPPSDPWTQQPNCPSTDWSGGYGSRQFSYSYASDIWVRLSSSSTDSKSDGPVAECNNDVIIGSSQAYQYRMGMRNVYSGRGVCQYSIGPATTGGTAQLKGSYDSTTFAFRTLNYTTGATQTDLRIYIYSSSEPNTSGIWVYRDGTLRTI